MNQLLSLMLVFAALATAGAQCPWEIDDDLQQPVLVLGGPYVLLCPTDSIQLSIQAQGTISSFSWNGPNGFTSNEQNPLVTQAGTYSLTVDYGGGCSETKAVNVTDNVASAPNIVVQGATINCRATRVRLRVTSDDGLSTFSWSGPPGFQGSTASNPLTDIPGDYRVDVVAANRCRYRFSTTVDVDTIKPAVSVDDIVAQSCDQATFQLAPTSVSIVHSTPSYSWSGPNGYRGSGDMTTTNMVGTYRIVITDPVNRCSASDVMEVLPHPDMPLIDLTPADVDCNTFSDSMVAEVSNCDNCVISWQGPNGFSTDDLGFDVNVETAGLYELVATEPASGCAAQLSITVSADTTPLRRIFRPNPVPVTCELPGEVRLFRPQDFEQILMFDVNAGTQVERDRISLDEPTLVYVESIDINGCFQRDTFDVVRREDPELTVNIEEDTLSCLGEPVTVGVSSSNYSLGELAELTWTFSDGSMATGAIVPVVSPGPFRIDVLASNGCVASIDTFVPIDFRQPSVIAMGGFFDCSQSGIVLQGSTSDSSILQSIWTGPRNFWTTDLSPTVINPGIYTFEVTAENGCTNTDTAEVSSQLQTLDTMNLIATNVNCVGTGQVLVQNFDPDVNYSWRPNSSNVTTPFVGDRGLFNQQGDFIIEGLHRPTSCVLIDSVSIEVDTALPIIQLEALDSIRCATREVVIQSSVDLPVQYQWSTADGLLVGQTQNADILAGQPGTYRLTATGIENQCSSSEEIVLNEAPSDLVDFAIEVSAPSCQGDHDGAINVTSVTGGAMPYMYSLGGDQFNTQSSFRNLRDDEYLLIIEDGDGCTLDTTIILQRVTKFDVDLGEDIRINLGQGVELEAVVDLPLDEVDSYVWSFNLADSCQDDCPIRSFRPIESNFYLVDVTSVDGCTISDTIFVQVVGSRGLFVPNAITPNGDGINDFAEVFVGPAIVSLDLFEIYDRWGTRVFAANDFSPGDPSARWDGRSGGTKLNPGVYVYTLRVTDIRGEIRDLMGEITLVR